ncbi:Glycosyltransferase sugar-binding region containing DXD motif-containing protein [Pedobacter terrae]|uniref:Glycosyltransferase sugar-binding region containing DXD motif-containing protein n=1 Tax=Pedobacter terrae TaxID=405671 RepID=A0A1G7NZ22_9SPHI|nr:glycosyltransferase [Pedobacter terrae]SDF79241.1 Glycosyltransferase sugar-binding region containing DXD motif-containing protein [Pedobacter terrae]
MKRKGISVIMPTYNQVSFISRAITSLLIQTFLEWELIIIVDGSTDGTVELIEKYLGDKRIKYFFYKNNKGLGTAANLGLENASYDYISYLPSDDLYFSDHLQSLWNLAEANPEGTFFCSGAKYNYQDNNNGSAGQKCFGPFADIGYQLVQIMHQKTETRWMERNELVTDSLNLMFWNRLLIGTVPKFTMKITSEWTSHPSQRHKIISERWGGGINLYKQFYNINQKLKYNSVFGGMIDEHTEYLEFDNPQNSPQRSGLKILLVGELAYNAERVLAFEEKGHQLYGLWTGSPSFFNAIGPLPFGNIIDVPKENWQEHVKEIKPDIIYALLNFQAIPFIHRVIRENLEIPFVWHFKEGPFFCRQKGLWDQMIDIFEYADGTIFLNQEIKIWYEQFFYFETPLSMILDGDLPHIDRFKGKPSPLLSQLDGEIHTVVPGRPLGLSPIDIQELSRRKIHLHIYGDFYHSVYKTWIEEANALAPGYLHLHPVCTPQNWVVELSKYDAGWLHIFDSENNGEMMKANWLDLNYAARMSTLGAAGLPMIQRDNTQHICASQSFTKKHGFGIFYNSFDDLALQLGDREKMYDMRQEIWKKREVLSFNYHIEEIISFFDRVIDSKKEFKGVSQKKSVDNIPKIIHQTWKNDQPPKHYQILTQTWKEHHPNWEYKLWTDQMNYDFIKNFFPSFLPIYEQYPSAIQKADAVKYFILYQYGGLFVDMDYECIQNVEELLEGNSVVFGSEPEDHCKKFYMDLIVSNAFMGCTPENNFFKFLCESIATIQIRNENTVLNTLNTTGPFFLTKLYKSFPGKTNVKILSAERISPLSMHESRDVLSGEITEEIQERLDRAHAVHYFFGSWWKAVKEDQNQSLN